MLGNQLSVNLGCLTGFCVRTIVYLVLPKSLSHVGFLPRTYVLVLLFLLRIHFLALGIILSPFRSGWKSPACNFFKLE